ncbi:nucleoside-diphosphate sugar epimerase [Nocardioides immobilis]|uniref:Nucleoside-diphosphate sugar epimerase n=1 Tax=Nocardioides immobilis TaxID=2049295 RepID=A0A417XU28_9ACTN|nr:NAD(P)H-binding protein [Nocardioides immobilis]RHW23761.1 nucleoside-diphosphate sugar epimerase [Nocardioides immobilis]
MRSENFLVVGAHGNVGSEVVAALLARGHHVVAPVRRPGRSLPPGATSIVADIADPTTLGIDLAAIQGMFVMAGHRGLTRLLRLAREHNVRHAVLLSAAAAEHRTHDNALTSYHLRAEEAVAESGLNWTFLRPQSFCSNALRWVPEINSGGDVRLPFPDLAVACVDPRDLGEIAALALTEPGHAGNAYRVTGPEALLPAEQLATVSTQTGIPLRGVPLNDQDTRAHLLRDNPEPIVNAFFALYRRGGLDESMLTRTVSDLLGRAPGSFADWVTRHRERFTHG